MFSRDLTLARYDAELFAAMEQEAQRQEEHIEPVSYTHLRAHET